jgi:hypothetical protein
MKSLKTLGMGVMLSAALLAGCGEDKPETPAPTTSQRCQSPAEYIAFDAANHASQDLRLVKIDEMVALFNDARTTPAKAAANAAQVLAIYTATDAKLQEKVRGRLDVHFTPATAVGAEIDKTITDAIEALRTAKDAHEVNLAKQRFEKAGMYRFLYLSVAEELFKEPSYKHYDEAYGYLGTGATNAAAGQRSLARLAASRDSGNGTTMSAELFDLMKEGGCVIETALKARGADAMAADADPSYAQLARRIDAKLQLVMAYSAGRYLLVFNTTDAKTAHIQLVEGESFFQVIEPHMLAAGGAKADVARELRNAYNDALSKVNNDATWPQSFPAQALLVKLEQAFGIDVKG